MNPLQLSNLLKRIGIVPVNMIPVKTIKKVIKNPLTKQTNKPKSK